MNNRTRNTLFLLMSVDGKISTGRGDGRDADKDFVRIKGISEGIRQYYDREQQTDLHSLNSGKVMAKMGVNAESSPINNPDVSFIIIDNSHLAATGVLNLADGLKKLYLVTKNPSHPAKSIDHDGLVVIEYEDKIDLADLFVKMRGRYGVDRITIQSGGTLNAEFLRLGLIDRLSVVVAPALVGGKDTPTLVDGESIIEEHELVNIKGLRLEKAEVLADSYLHLFYRIIQETRVADF